MRVKDLFSKIKRPYCYVPNCPVCGSYKTAKIIKSYSLYENDWAMKEALKNGELLAFMEEVPSNANAFCFDCNNKWDAVIETKLLTGDEIEEQKALRGTTDLYNAHASNLKIKEKEKEDKRGFFTNSVCKYIGHI